MYGQGISREGEIVDLGTEFEVIDKSGAWYSYNGDRLGQGKENVKNFMRENPEVMAEIDRKIRQEMGIIAPDEVTDSPEKGASESAAPQKEEADSLFDDELV